MFTLAMRAIGESSLTYRMTRSPCERHCHLVATRPNGDDSSATTKIKRPQLNTPFAVALEALVFWNR
jgi:hypothetical protein